MALGTFTFPDKADSQGPTFFTRVSVTGDTSYPAGGTTGLLAALRAHHKDQRAILGIIPQDCGGYMLTYIPSTDKLKVYENDPTAGAEGPLPEVDATDNLGATTFIFIVISQ
jgi:hypothetical protein